MSHEKKQFTASVDKALLKKTCQLAAARQTGFDEIIEETLKGRIEQEEWLKRAIEKGRRDFKEGRVIPHEEVERILNEKWSD